MNSKKVRRCSGRKRIVHPAITVNSEVTGSKITVENETSATTTYCVACGIPWNSIANNDTSDLVKTEPMSEGMSFGTTVGNYSFCTEQNIPLLGSQEQRIQEKKLLQQFCILMGVKLTGFEFEEWNNEGETSKCSSWPCPLFCHICKNQLALLEDLQNKLKDLERDLKQRTNEFQQKCRNSEVKFQQEHVYKKDKFCFKIRRQISGNVCTPVQTKESTLDETVIEHTRNDTAIRTHAPSSLSEHEICVKLELEDAQNNSDNEPTFEYHLNDDELLESSCSEDNQNYERPKKSSCTKKPSTQPNKIKSTNRSLSLQKRRQTELSSTDKKRMKRSCTTSRTSANLSSSSRKSIRADASDSDYLPSEEDNDADSAENIEKEVETHLKKQIRKDPTTGELTFLHVSFKASENGKYRCLACDTETKPIFRSSIKNHTITKHTDMFVCQECDQHCPSAEELTSHIRRVHRGEDRTTVECPVCGKPCSSKRGRMEKHMVTHMSNQEKEDAVARGETIPQWSKTRRHVCEECGMCYETKSFLIQHKIREHPNEDYTEEEKMAFKEMCPDCGKLIHRYYLKQHRERLHSKQLKRFCCPICEKRFSTGKYLRQHKRVVHENIKPFQCYLCPKQFAFGYVLKNHLNNHKNIRPFECDHCDMAFVQKHHLERHAKSHQEPGANPRRKTYVRGPVTKANSDEEKSRVDLQFRHKGNLDYIDNNNE